MTFSEKEPLKTSQESKIAYASHKEASKPDEPTAVPAQPDASPGSKTSQDAPSAKNYKRNKMLWWLTFVLGIIGLGWFLLWYFYLQHFVSTDDAYANGSLVNITPAVSGSVTAFYADDTDLVLEGQVLVEMDPIPYQVAYEKALASLASEVLQVRQLRDDVLSSTANVAVRKAMLSKAQFDHNNRAQLVGSKAVSQEDFIHSRDDLTIAENQLKQAEYQLMVAQDLLGNTPIESHPLLEERKSTVRDAYYNLRHCTIYAPTTGYIAKRVVNVGQSVQRTSNLMAIIPKDYVWAEANYKETELTYMRVGQPAKVWFDIYGSSVVYEGKVLGIGSGSGSVFSLIPPQNATGNWIKIVQRIPVRVSLDPEVVKKYPVRLGISAEVTVDVTDQNLPMLTQVPPKEPVATTKVFDIQFDEVNALIDQIVEANLKQEKTQSVSQTKGKE